MCFVGWRRRMQRKFLGKQGSNVLNLIRHARPQRQLAFVLSYHSLSTCQATPRLREVPLKFLGAFNDRSSPVHGFRVHSRNASLFSRLRRDGRSSEPFSPASDGQDEAGRAAILEKVMKGRQPADLMLRCMYTIFYATEQVLTEY